MSASALSGHHARRKLRVKKLVTIKVRCTSFRTMTTIRGISAIVHELTQ
jgi:hypothetical protein